jgi:hypothetical protein
MSRHFAFLKITFARSCTMTARTRLAWLERAVRSDCRIASPERKCNTSAKGVIMTTEQIKALAAVRAAFVAAETTGLTEAEIYQAAVTGLVHPEVKSGRPPGNYNPIADCLEKPKSKAQHE